MQRLLLQLCPGKASFEQLQDPSRVACAHFLGGSCSFGDGCRNSHSLFAARPVCQFFLSTDAVAERAVFSRTKMIAVQTHEEQRRSSPLVPLVAKLSLFPGW
jgi:hypothetical protein